jgi:hypothetical protein
VAWDPGGGSRHAIPEFFSSENVAEGSLLFGALAINAGGRASAKALRSGPIGEPSQIAAIRCPLPGGHDWTHTAVLEDEKKVT